MYWLCFEGPEVRADLDLRDLQCQLLTGLPSASMWHLFLDSQCILDLLKDTTGKDFTAGTPRRTNSVTTL